MLTRNSTVSTQLAVDRENRVVETRGTIFIDGQWQEAASGKTLPAIDPATGAEIGRISAGGEADVERAVAAAKRAAKNWAETSATARAALLRRAGELVVDNLDELAWLEALDTGHYLEKARQLIGAIPAFLDYHAGYADKVGGRTIPVGGNRLSFTELEPLGVTAHIIPWNYPAVLFVRSTAPALALGNTVVIKPAEDTSLVAVRLAELFDQAGFPPGVVNVVTGTGPEAGAKIAAHPDVAGITFIGSTETGKAVAKLGVEHMAQLNLELGGKSPIVVFDDARIDDAVEATVQGFCSHAGQICIATTRLYLHTDIYDDFLAKLKDRLSSVKVGDSFDPATNMGAIVSKRQFERVRSYIEIGKTEATLFHGGSTPQDVHEDGFFLEPTVFVDVNHNARILREEIFGPVLVVMPFDDREQLVEQVNDTPFGLFACVWSQDITTALSIARATESGSVMINDWAKESPLAPHGGFKQSGVGRENGLESIASYTRIKHTLVNLNPSLRAEADWAAAPL